MEVSSQLCTLVILLWWKEPPVHRARLDSAEDRHHSNGSPHTANGRIAWACSL